MVDWTTFTKGPGQHLSHSNTASTCFVCVWVYTHTTYTLYTLTHDAHWYTQDRRYTQNQHHHPDVHTFIFHSDISGNWTPALSSSDWQAAVESPDPVPALPNWICEASCRRPLIASCKPPRACCGPLLSRAENKGPPERHTLIPQRY